MEHLPPWLRNLPLPPRPASAAGAEPSWLHAAEPAAPPPAAGDMPDWLRDLQGELADETPPSGERPPWSEAAPAPAADDDTPDWLRDLEREAATPPAPDAPARPSPFGATSWLTGLGQESASEEPPAQEPPQPPPTTTTSRIRMPVGATDWLRSIGQEPDADEPPAPAERAEATRRPAEEEPSGVPDWLRDLTPEELSAEAEEEYQAAPDSQPVFDPQAPGWLHMEDLPAPEASTVAADAEPPLDETVASSDDVPDWLRDIVPADELPARGRREQSGPPAWLAADDEGGAGDLGGDVPGWLREAAGDDEPRATRGEDVPAWLREADEAPAAPAPAPGASAGEEIPSWLREADETPAAPAPAPGASAGEEIPSWLREADETPAAPASEIDAGEEIPSWLREADEAPAAPARRGEEVPAWLREADEAPAAPAQPAAPAPSADADDEVPAWLREMEPPSAPPPSSGSPGDMPTWLREAAAEAPAPAEATPDWLRAPDERPAPVDDQPTWLREALDEDEPGEAAPGWLSAPAAAPEPPAPPAGDLPPWLAAEQAGPAPAAQPAGEMSLPSWLRGVSDEPEPPPPPRAARSPEEPPRRSATPTDSEGDDFLRGADLPSWLRPSEPERAAEAAEAQTFDWLKGLGAVDQEDEAAPAAAAVGTAVVPRRAGYTRSPEQLEAAALLSQIVRSPYPEPAPAPAAAAPSRWQRIGMDRLLYALLALTVIVGLLLPQLIQPLGSAAPVAPAAADLSAAIDQLGSEDVVLVAYEWGAQRSAELRPLEQAVMQRLMADKVKLILVSTDLQGTLLSFDQRETLRNAGYNREADGREFGGRDYVLLGYRPGGELALRSIARDLRGELRRDFIGQDATQGLLANNPDGSPRISGIQDVAMILVMADQPQDVQAWMEQVHRAAPAVPIAFLLPQEAQPLVQPYLATDGVLHLAGRQGALAFAAGAEGADQTAIAQASGQQSLAVVAWVLLLLAGGVAVALRRSGRTRGGAA